ncbi:MAG: Gfo/Idh/MocA family oxidoreductase [Myxococcota bacterium]|nr:Gfo/Idh/MocA family oxidoreductase [Myxococcota bacterium]
MNIIDSPRIAIVGCGAIAESFHLPALAKHQGVVERSVLVDPDTARTEHLSRKFGIKSKASSHNDVLGEIDGAVVTTPHHLHFPIARDCLTAGAHVLCEKPLAVDPKEAHELVALAENKGVGLAVNNTRRLYPSYRRISEILNQGELGEIQRFVFHEGEVMAWPAATGFYFGLMGAAKGVLLDRGAHVLDLICWWLGGKPEIDRYQDDSFGGSEATAEVSFHLNGCVGNAYLSWLSRYPNKFRIEGTQGAIEAGIYELSSFFREDAIGQREKVRIPTKIRTFNELGGIIIDDFIDVVRDGSCPVVQGSDVLASLALLDECYAMRTRFEMPWHENCEVSIV